ncbi:MAG TPA: dihydrolipoamide acetyltransferase family protein [Casimicrobiaceae bacterium]|nr:dihydrolipoamide acetyltransferase family protein [Casimicrobiaceae bacterium]
MVQFIMPKLGADMTQGKLVEWCKKPGQPIRRGEIIAVIETDKANVDTESFVDGVFESALVEPHDEWLPVGTPLAVIRVEGEAPPQVAPAVQPTAAAPAVAALAPGPAPAMRVPVAEAALERPKISPAARKHVLDLGIDPARISGTGPGGRITLEDVDRAAAAVPPAPAPAPAPTEVPDKVLRMRDAIAATMARSKREIPHYYLATTIVMAKALGWLEARNNERPVTERLLPGVLLIKATALALRRVPELNGFWLNGRAEPSRAIHVGVAISLRGGGLVAPALHDAEQCSLDELMRRLQDLTKRARANSLRSSEMTDPTITVTSLGERGVESVFGIIYPPQLALVGFGKLVERPWVVDDGIVTQPVVTATLSGDHRATDGHRGALLLDAIDRLLQEPEKL